MFGQLQPEADSTDGVNQLDPRRLSQLAAQIPDVDVHHIALRVEVQVPHFFKEIGPADHVLRAEEEVFE